jgi:DNA mismatch repair protein MutL
VPAAPVRTYANIDIEATKRPERIPPLEQAEPVSGESISELRTAVPAAPVRAYANIDIEATKRPERIPPPPDEPVCAPEQPAWTILGELFDTYILVQQGDLFHLIDKHAAHERFQYNRLRHIGEEPADRQVLLTPEAITLPREEAFALLEHPEALAAVGITVDDLGEGTLVVREIPMILTDCPLRDVLSEIAGKLIANRRGLTPSFIDELLYSVACRSAVMAGRKSSMPELRVLAELVLGEENIRFCPHGRPALVTLKKREIEKMFGRLG